MFHQGVIGVKMVRDAIDFFSCSHWSELRINRSSGGKARDGAPSSIRRLVVGLLQTWETRTAVCKVQKNSDDVLCSVSPSPVPEITWKRANGVPFPSKVKMKYSNAVLEMPSFQQDDTGGYECVAENRMGKNTATGRLAFYGTQIVSFPARRTARQHHSSVPGLVKRLRQ